MLSVTPLACSGLAQNDKTYRAWQWYYGLVIGKNEKRYMFLQKLKYEKNELNRVESGMSTLVL